MQIKTGNLFRVVEAYCGILGFIVIMVCSTILLAAPSTSANQMLFMREKFGGSATWELFRFDNSSVVLEFRGQISTCPPIVHAIEIVFADRIV